MLSSPRLGQRVQVWYAARYRDVMPWHGRIGAVTVRGTRSVVGTGEQKRPRNHAIEIDGCAVCVPCGNLRSVQ